MCTMLFRWMKMFTVKLEIKDCHKLKESGMLGCIQGVDLQEDAG